MLMLMSEVLLNVFLQQVLNHTINSTSPRLMLNYLNRCVPEKALPSRNANANANANAKVSLDLFLQQVLNHQKHPHVLCSVISIDASLKNLAK